MDKHTDGSNSTRRRDLYDLVWTTPISKLAPTMGFSDVGLAKVCDRHQIPRLGRGYWTRLQFGRKVKQEPLPDIEDEELEIVVVNPPGAPKATDAAPLLPAPTIVVPARLTSPRPLVATTAALLRNQQPGDYGLVRSSARQGGLEVEVSPGAVGRSMRILNTLMKALEERGWAVSVRQEGWNPAAFVLIEEREIPIKLRESVKREERPPTVRERKDAEKFPDWYGGPWYQHVPTGLLQLSFDLGYFGNIRKNWRDGKRQRVEDLLGKMMVALSQYEVEERERRRHQLERERLEQEEAQRRAKEETRAREEQARVDHLMAEVDAWLQAERIRAYVDDVQRRVHQAHGEEISDRFRAWKGWAMRQADRLDPLLRDDAESSES